MMTKEDFMTQYNKSDAQKVPKKKLKAVLMKNILCAKHALKIVFIGFGYMNYVLRKHDNMQITVVIGLLALGVVNMVTGVHYDIVLIRCVGLAEIVTSFTDLVTLIVYDSGYKLPLDCDKL